MIALAMLLACAAAASASRVLYATDTANSRLYGFGIGSDGGIASWVSGSPFVNQTGPTALVVSRDAATLYAALSTGVRPYAIDPSSGSLTAGTVIAAGANPTALAISPNGTQLYVGNSGSDSISRFALNSDGSLPLSVSATTSTGVGTAPDAIAITPDGAHLYVAYSGTGKIGVFDINPTTGALSASAVGPYDAGTTPSALTMAPSGSYLYAALEGDGKIAAYAVNAASGALFALTGSPYDDGAATSAPTGIAITPDGTRLLVANSGDGTIGRYVITGGVPAANLGDGPTVAGAHAVVISPDGKHAFVAGSSSVAAFDVSSLAALTARGTPQVTNEAHSALAITPNQGPVARVNAVAAPATIASRFQGGPSTDSDGSVVQWSWDFGDGTTATGDTGEHVYPNPGTYTVSVTVTDNEGCSAVPVYTGQQMACVPSGFSTWSQDISVGAAPDNTAPDQTCSHDGDDGFCGTPDHKAPQATILGINDGAQINDIDAPTQFAGSLTPDPSGIQSVKMRFTKAAGTIRAKKTVRKKVCRTRKVHGKKRRTCKRKKVTVRTNTKVPACQTFAGAHNYLVTYQCSKVPWIAVTSGDGTFRYDLPVALGLGSYTVQVLAVDGANNSDVIEKSRNSISFKIVKTPANTGTGAGDTSGGTTTTTTPPPNDTGSPF